MKKILPVILLLGLLLSCADIPVKPVSSFIEDTKAEVCPDSRVNIFDVEYTQKGKVVTLEGEMNSSKGLSSMVAALEEEGYTVANKIRLLPDKELKGMTYGLVNKSVANMRVEPSARAEMATQAVLGTPIRIYKKADRGDNYLVQTPDGYLGWMEKSAFVPMTPQQFKSWKISERIIYLTDNGYVYQNRPRTPRSSATLPQRACCWRDHGSTAFIPSFSPTAEKALWQMMNVRISLTGKVI